MRFAAAWSNVASEHADAQRVWIDPFDVFGTRRRVVASFEGKAIVSSPTSPRQLMQRVPRWP